MASRSSHSSPKDNRISTKRRTAQRAGLQSSQPTRTKFQSVILVLTCTFALLVQSANGTAVGISLSTIGRSLNVDEETLQWLVSGYTLSSGCMLLLFGRVADQYGRKKTFICGSIWLTAFTLGCGFANDATTLNILRAFQGAGTAATVPACLGILAHSFPASSRSRAIAFATFSAGAPIGGVMGVAFGGVLIEITAPTWRTTFFFLAALTTICIVGALISFDPDVFEEGMDRRIDWIGGFLVTVGLVLVVFVLGQAETTRQKWRTNYIIALLIVGVLFLVLFVLWQAYLERISDRSESTGAISQGSDPEKGLSPSLKRVEPRVLSLPRRLSIIPRIDSRFLLKSDPTSPSAQEFDPRSLSTSFPTVPSPELTSRQNSMMTSITLTPPGTPLRQFSTPTSMTLTPPGTPQPYSSTPTTASTLMPPEYSRRSSVLNPTTAPKMPSRSWLAPPPLMKLSLWGRANGRFAATMCIAFLTYGAFISWIFWVQLYYQNLLQLSPLATVVRLLPMFVSGLICNIIVAFVVSHIPLVFLMSIGALGTSIACLLFALINPSQSFWMRGFPGAICSVLGADFVFAGGVIYVSHIAKQDEQSLAGGLFQTMTQIGASVGVTVTTVIFNRVTERSATDSNPSPDPVLASYHAAQWGTFTFGIVAAVLAVVFFRGVGVVGKQQPKPKPKPRTTKRPNAHDSQATFVHDS